MLYTAAKVAARMRDPATALAWLDRLEKAGLGDELDPDDFVAIADLPAYRERAKRFARAQPAVRCLATPNGIYMGGIDGLAQSGNKIIGVQNLVGRSRIWSLTLDAKEASIGTARALLRGHKDFRNPTTGAIADGRFLFVADPNLQTALPTGGLTPLPAGRTGHRVLALPMP